MFLMHFRRPLMFLLSLGVVFGYGGAIAGAHYRAHHGCPERWGHHARFDDRAWGDRAGDRFDRFDDRDGRFDRQRAEPERTAAPAATPQPQTVVVQPSAPAAAPAPQIFFIMPGATAPQAVTATPAAASPAPAAP
jgi:hypothetical protein